MLTKIYNSKADPYIHRYMLTVKVSDKTGGADFVMFDYYANQILNYTAEYPNMYNSYRRLI